MGKPLGARKNGKFKAVSTAPSFNKTPIGSSTPPVPYPVYHDLSNSTGTVSNVYFNRDPVYVLNQTTQTKCKGDDPGTAKGVKSGTVNGEIKPTSSSSSVNVGKKPLVREGDKCTLNAGNCPGVYVTEPAVTPATSPKEKKKFSLDIHDVLDVLGFIPVLGAIPDLANAGIYALEGNYALVGLSVVAAVPGYGDAVKGGAMVVKGGKKLLVSAEKRALKEAEQKILKEAEKKVLKEAEAKALKKTEEKALKEAEEKTLTEAEKKAAKKDGARVKGKKKGPCDDLKKGKGKGDYRGGAHKKTKDHGEKNKGGKRQQASHHMPADDASTLPNDDGPAIQIDTTDHQGTTSNGSGLNNKKYRNYLKELLAKGEWRKVMATEIRDVRRVAKKAGNIRKYNQAVKEMIAYAKCLAKHGLLK